MVESGSPDTVVGYHWGLICASDIRRAYVVMPTGGDTSSGAGLRPAKRCACGALTFWLWEGVRAELRSPDAVERREGAGCGQSVGRRQGSQLGSCQGRDIHSSLSVCARACLDRTLEVIERVPDPLTADDSAGEA